MIFSNKLFICLVIFIFSINFCKAQSKKRADYNIKINILGEKSLKYFGIITNINDSAIVIKDRMSLFHTIPYKQINKLKVYKRHSDIGYTVITTALALGVIGGSQNFEDAPIATAVGIGGAIGVVTISTLLHNVIHSPKVKLKASRTTIDYQIVNKKVRKYLVLDKNLVP